ncbi:DgyrCDS6798 [Dimorphilus gyrociliatus]|uniref:DgyrCDS6798 n=1 Tax=Dimorphilus gyrociliatus TaxID=2664684 RepID=A0A7I8VQQ0_9ANNE|nr:DgyrCDS6798 [Dimorphilus gyrociliatus]
MRAIFRLEDQAFHHVMKQLDNYKDEYSYIEYLKNRKVPPVICDRLFNELNGFYAGLPDDVIKVFANDDFPLNNIRFGDTNFRNDASIEFLKCHKLRGLTIENLELTTIEELLDLINCEELKTLSFHHCREVHQFEDVNISETSITDIRLLKRHVNLEHLDCTELIDNACKSYIHLHCFVKLKRLRFGNSSSKIKKLQMTLINQINPLIKKFLTKEEIENYNELPERFKSKRKWDLTEFIELSYWKDLSFIDILGESIPCPRSVCNFIARHEKLEFVGLTEEFPDILERSVIEHKNVYNLFDICHFEKIYGRNDMSFKILYTKKNSNIDLREIWNSNDISYNEMRSPVIFRRLARNHHDHYVIECHSELTRILADELAFEKFSFYTRQTCFGETCWNILCTDIEQSECIIVIVKLIAERFLQRDFYLSDLKDSSFMDLLTQYHKYFKMATNINYIYRKIFDIPEKNKDDLDTCFTNYSFMKILVIFLGQLNLEQITRNELDGLFRGMKRINRLKHWKESQDLLEQLHVTMLQIMTYCSNKHGWDLTELENYIERRLIRCKFICTGSTSVYLQDDNESDDSYDYNSEYYVNGGEEEEYGEEEEEDYEEGDYEEEDYEEGDYEEEEEGGVEQEGEADVEFDDADEEGEFEQGEEEEGQEQGGYEQEEEEEYEQFEDEEEYEQGEEEGEYEEGEDEEEYVQGEEEGEYDKGDFEQGEEEVQEIIVRGVQIEVIEEEAEIEEMEREEGGEYIENNTHNGQYIQEVEVRELPLDGAESDKGDVE